MGSSLESWVVGFLGISGLAMELQRYAFIEDDSAIECGRKWDFREWARFKIGTGEGVVGVNISTNSSKTPDAFLALDILALKF